MTKRNETNETPGVCPRSGTRSLADGLLVAQGAIDGVAKDARNTFHKYAYTSAEGMIGACRAALQTGGIAARRVSWRIEGDGLYVVSRMSVVHGFTGEAAESETVWPIVVEKGRPVDKAVASALTTSLSYWLRDLLCLPREDESGHMDGRNDDRAETRHGMRDRAAAASPVPAAPERPGRARSESTRALNDRIAAQGDTATRTAVQATPRQDAPTPPQTNGTPPSEPTARSAAILHTITARDVRGTPIHVAEFVADGVATSYIVGDGLLDVLRAAIGATLVPVVSDRGPGRMPLLQDFRTVPTEGGTDESLPF
jgi:hypothetical protein